MWTLEDISGNVEDIFQILKYIKSIKGGFGEYAERTNSKDINKVSSCCFNFDRVLDENQDGE